jgi:CHASE3 domain sensor protein
VPYRVFNDSCQTCVWRKKAVELCSLRECGYFIFGPDTRPRMNQFFRQLLKRQGVKSTLYLIIALILIDTAFTYSYKLALNENIEVQKKLDEILTSKGTIISNLNNIDMSLRGYLLVQNEAFLGTYEKIKSQSRPTMRFLDKQLPSIGIDASVLTNMNKMLDNYFDLMDEVVGLSKAGAMEDALKIIKADHGTAVWETYMKLSGVVDPVITEQKDAAQKKYADLLDLNLIFQSILLLIGIPTLIYTIINLSRSEARRKNLFEQLDRQNRSLIFDSNKPTDIQDEDRVIGDIIGNLNKAATFIKNIAQGNYEVKWDGFSHSGSEVNRHNISGELLQMRDEMKKKREEGIRQQWVSEGLNKVSEIIRDHQTNFEMLCEKTVAFIVKYLKAQQGGLFVLNEEDESDPHIALVCCYAFDKKKFVTKRVEIGNGLLGQAFLEGEPIYLTDVPQDYIRITSGLGEANPRCLTIYPMKHNDTVVALIEIASFTPNDQYALDFLGNACKSIAASVIAIQSNAKTKLLLEKSQQQAEEMRAQEEEMRQNMEELEATQEEMKRREIDLKNNISKYERSNAA